MSTEASTHAPTPSDATLMRRVRAGDGAAFATVYERHVRAAYVTAARMLPAAAAEDVVQEAFINLWRTGAYDPAYGGLRAYLLTIVRNRAVDRLRKDQRRVTESPLDEALGDRLPADERTHEDAEARELACLIRSAVSQLPDAQRRALELAYYGELSQSEIAGLLKVPLGTIKGRLRLGLQRLGRDGTVLACR